VGRSICRNHLKLRIMSLDPSSFSCSRSVHIPPASKALRHALECNYFGVPFDTWVYALQHGCFSTIYQ